MIEAVVFDMDGILFDTERLSAASWREAARRMGLGDVEEGIYGCIGLNRADGEIFLKKTYGESFPCDAFRKCSSAIFHEAVEKQGLPVMKGARELLEWLYDKGVKTALASSTHTDGVRQHLERAGFTRYFRVVIGGDMVQHSKPQPDIYLKACHELGAEPGKTAAVEDSFNGIRSAYRAGMLPVMVPDMVEPTEEIRKMLYCRCENLFEVKELFEKEGMGESR